VYWRNTVDELTVVPHTLLLTGTRPLLLAPAEARLLHELRTRTLGAHYYPEGGWGWVVCVCACAAHALTNGFQLAYGVTIVHVGARYNVVLDDGVGNAAAGESNRTVRICRSWLLDVPNQPTS
jgi:hypothetical protein